MWFHLNGHPFGGTRSAIGAHHRFEVFTKRVAIGQVYRNSRADREEGGLAQVGNALGIVGGVAVSVQLDERLNCCGHASTVDRRPQRGQGRECAAASAAPAWIASA